jgi:transposase
MRAVVHALFSVVDGGMTWRMLPHDYPKWPCVSWYCSPWRASGAWQRRHDTLRAQLVAALRNLAPAIMICFIDVLVMDEDMAVRNNRLALRQPIASLPRGIVDLSCLVGF